MLPKIRHPLTQVEIPSTKQKIQMRPYLTKEEKILAMAKFSRDSKDILMAIRQVVNNAIVTKGVDIDKLAIFDLEYLFLKLSAFSVSNVIEVEYEDKEDGKIRKFSIDLNTIGLKKPEKEISTVKVTDTIGIKLKYPPAKLYADAEFLEDEKTDFIDKLIISCIDSVWENEKKYDIDPKNKEEIVEFIDSLPVSAYKELQAFIRDIPHLFYEIKYTNDMEHERTITFNSIDDFFIFR